MCSFDGQWSSLVVRDGVSSPLTVLQLQKDVFSKVKKMSKTDILTEIFSSNVVDAKDPNSVENGVNLEFHQTKQSISISSKSPRCFNMSQGLVKMLKEKSHRRCDAQTTEVDDNLISSLPTNVVSKLDENIIHEMSKVTQTSNPLNHSEMYTEGISTLFDDTVEYSSRVDFVDQIRMDNNKIDSQEESVAKLLDENDLHKMLDSLKKDERANREGKWNMEVLNFEKMLKNADTINTNFRAYELQACLKPVIGKLKSSGIHINMSSAKYVQVNVLSRALGDQSEIQANSHGKKKEAKWHLFLEKNVSNCSS